MHKGLVFAAARVKQQLTASCHKLRKTTAVRNEHRKTSTTSSWPARIGMEISLEATMGSQRFVRIFVRIKNPSCESKVLRAKQQPWRELETCFLQNKICLCTSSCKSKKPFVQNTSFVQITHPSCKTEVLRANQNSFVRDKLPQSRLPRGKTLLPKTKSKEVAELFCDQHDHSQPLLGK